MLEPIAIDLPSTIQHQIRYAILSIDQLDIHIRGQFRSAHDGKVLPQDFPQSIIISADHVLFTKQPDLMHKEPM